MEVLAFTCSICGEASRDICVFCTKDACGNHLCERCHRCSDCCVCDMRMRTVDHELNGHPNGRLAAFEVTDPGS